MSRSADTPVNNPPEIEPGQPSGPNIPPPVGPEVLTPPPDGPAEPPGREIPQNDPVEAPPFELPPDQTVPGRPEGPVTA